MFAALPLSLEQTATAQRNTAEWKVERGVDDFIERRVVVVASAPNLVGGRAFNVGLSCTNGRQLMAQFLFLRRLGPRVLSWRIGDDQPVSVLMGWAVADPQGAQQREDGEFHEPLEGWQPRRTGFAIGIERPRAVILDWVSAMRNGEFDGAELRYEVATKDGQRYRGVVSLQGFGSAADEILKACPP